LRCKAAALQYDGFQDCATGTITFGMEGGVVVSTVDSIKDVDNMVSNGTLTVAFPKTVPIKITTTATLNIDNITEPS